MEKEYILGKIDEIIETSINHHNYQISLDLKPEEITGWDSMVNAMVITSIEKCFEIKLKFSEIIAWKTIGDLVDIIYKKLQ